MTKAKGRTPRSCQACEHWKEVRNRMRVADVLAGLITKMEKNLQAADFKASLGDYLKLVQFEKEVGGEDGPKEIKVSWIEPESPSTGE